MGTRLFVSNANTEAVQILFPVRELEAFRDWKRHEYRAAKKLLDQTIVYRRKQCTLALNEWKTAVKQIRELKELNRHRR